MTRTTPLSSADQPWLTAPATRAVLDALEAEGGAGCTRFVGGCVRNALRGQPVDDIDIATTLTPDRTMAALKAAGIKAVPTGLDHGTVTAVAERRPFEITTLRRDVSTDGRRATVAFTDDWAEDAARRDFRLNALYADRDGTIFDPTGQGVADAEAGRVVFVGDPRRRIEEDYLRILRFFRFFAGYGEGAPDAEGLAACRDLAPGMAQLSAERVSKELLKLLAAPDPRAAVKAMADSGVLAGVLPEARLTPAFERLVARSPDPALRLMLLLPPTVEAAETAARSLRLPNGLRDRLVAAARAAPEASGADDDRAVRALAYRQTKPAALDALTRRAVEADDPSATDALIAALQRWDVPRLPVGGRDLARLGVEPGPEHGRLLRAFEDQWVAADFPAEGHAERLEALVSGRG